MTPPLNVLEKKDFLRNCLTSIDAFPLSLSMIHATGLGEFLSDETIQKLKHIENDLHENVNVTAILQAENDEKLVSKFGEALTSAAGYYIQSGIAVWNDLGLDYTKLINLTRVSCQLIEEEFFNNRKRLSRSSFINTVSGLRVLREVGKRLTEEQEDLPPGDPPLTYLKEAITSTFVLWCLLSYIRGSAKGVRKTNVKELAQTLFSSSQKAFQEATVRGLFETEAIASFWSPDWQKGEVEADLDERDGEVRSFSSVEELIKDLHSA